MFAPVGRTTSLSTEANTPTFYIKCEEKPLLDRMHLKADALQHKVSVVQYVLFFTEILQSNLSYLEAMR